MAITQGSLITATELSSWKSDATSRASTHCPNHYARHNGNYDHQSNLSNNNNRTNNSSHCRRN